MAGDLLHGEEEPPHGGPEGGGDARGRAGRDEVTLVPRVAEAAEEGEGEAGGLGAELGHAGAHLRRSEFGCCLVVKELHYMCGGK